MAIHNWIQTQIMKLKRHEDVMPKMMAKKNGRIERA